MTGPSLDRVQEFPQGMHNIYIARDTPPLALASGDPDLTACNVEALLIVSIIRTNRRGAHNDQTAWDAILIADRGGVHNVRIARAVISTLIPWHEHSPSPWHEVVVFTRKPREVA